MEPPNTGRSFNIIPNIGIDIVTLTANEERIVAEIDVSGTQKGKVSSSSPGLEKKFQVRGAFVYLLMSFLII